MFRMLLTLMVIVLGSVGGYAQKQSEANKFEQPHAVRLENVRIRAQSIEKFFSKLSLSYDIPVGLEVAANDDEFATYDVEFKNGSLEDLLNLFVKTHNQYTWATVDGVINIFPKDGYRDSAINELLTTEISNFKIEENTSCFKLVDLLLATSEVKTRLEVNGLTQSGLNFSGGYFPQLGPRFKLEVSNMTVRSILNKVAKESPLARIWVTKKYGAESTFFIRLKAYHSITHQNKDY